MNHWLEAPISYWKTVAPKTLSLSCQETCWQCISSIDLNDKLSMLPMLVLQYDAKKSIFCQPWTWMTQVVLLHLLPFSNLFCNFSTFVAFNFNDCLLGSILMQALVIPISNVNYSFNQKLWKNEHYYRRVKMHQRRKQKNYHKQYEYTRT